MSSAPLAGTTVLDVSRNAPGPYASLLLAHLGAKVITIGGGGTSGPMPPLTANKIAITLDLRSQPGRRALHKLISTTDVFLEGYRPGVASRLGAGYDELRAINPRLIYCSLTGYGQSGPYRQQAGHDLNYLALVGILGCIGPTDRPPTPPVNLIADMGGGGLWAAFGILSGLLLRQSSGKGCYIDAAMIDGALSMMGIWFDTWGTSVMPLRGLGLVGGTAPFYRCYPCSDGKYVAVGAIEPQFFRNLWTLLDLGDEVPDHLDPAQWDRLTRLIGDALLRLSRDEWAARALHTDACVTPVLEPPEVGAHPQVSPRFGSTEPGATRPPLPEVDWLSYASDHPPEAPLAATERILRDAGLEGDELAEAITASAAVAEPVLPWPPLN